MAIEISEVVGKENMNPEAKEAVIRVLRESINPATVKRYLYARWARVLGIVPTREDLNRVAIWGDGE